MFYFQESFELVCCVLVSLAKKRATCIIQCQKLTMKTAWFLNCLCKTLYHTQILQKDRIVCTELLRPTIQRTSSKNNIPVIIYLLVLNMTKMQQVNLKPCLFGIFYKPQKSLTKLEDLHTFADLENCQFRKKKGELIFHN